MADDEVSHETEHLVTHYRVYGIRWIQLIVYVLATFANAIHGMTFSPIASQTKTFYNISITEVNTLANVFLFLYTIGTILSIWLSRKLPIRVIMIIGAVLNLGVFIRIFSLINPHQGYSALIIGQLFPAMAGPFFLNSPALLAARWFAPSQRDIATAIASMANPLGNAIGTLLPSLIISGDNATRNQFLILLSVEGGFTVLTTLLVIIICRSDPPTPPSPSEEHHQEINLKGDLIKLCTNIHYLTLLFGFSLGLAVFNAITTLLYQIIEPSHFYTSDDAGIFGTIIIISGLFNAVLAGVIMDKTHAYRIILKVLLVGACGSAIFFIIILRPKEYYPLAVSFGLMGFFLLPLLPVTFECAVECTYPIRAEWSTGLLLCIGNTLGGVFTFLLQYLISLAPDYKEGQIFTPASIFMFCIFIISSVCFLTYRGPYLRLEAEREADDTMSANI